MKKKQLASALVGAFGMMLLILDSKTAIQGAEAGTQLCVRTLIPSLFPFLVVSGMLTGALSGQALPFLRTLGRICGIPGGAESVLAVGLLGGYPVGAQCVTQSWKSGAISKDDAARMLGFCSNAGPSFLFGILGSMFSDRMIVWVLWGVHIASAIMVGAVTATNGSVGMLPIMPSSISLPEALDRSIKTMGRICGWVIVFRIVVAFLEKWIFSVLPPAVQVLVAGLLELSNGCILLGEIELEGLRFLIAGCILALGGLCVTMQTVSVTENLSLRYYFPGKLLQCCFSVILCFGSQFIFPEAQRCRIRAIPAAALALALLLVIRLRKLKNSSRNPALCGV